LGFTSNLNCQPYVIIGSNEVDGFVKLERVFVEEVFEDVRQYNFTSIRDFSNYTSDYFVHVHIDKLLPSTKYFYHVGSNVMDVELDSWDTSVKRSLLLQGGFRVEDSLSFTTAPLSTNKSGEFVPLKFALVGDLGQTEDSLATMKHIANDEEVNAILHAGDMSYADSEQNRWDSWFEMIKFLSNRVPWLVCPGNHEIETNGITKEIFVPYQSRFAMPEVKSFEMEPALSTNASNPSVFHDGRYDFGNSFYSTVYGSAKIFFLNCYTKSDTESNQYQWLNKELNAVDRKVTPWLIALVHCPIYDTFLFHHNETQTNDFRDSFEPLFVNHRVNFVFAGHEHAYMRSKSVAYGKLDKFGPKYVIIGDGGNREGHGEYFSEVEEEWIDFRDNTIFGYGSLSILNHTHSRWNWVKDNGMLGTEIFDESFIVNQFFID